MVLELTADRGRGGSRATFMRPFGGGRKTGESEGRQIMILFPGNMLRWETVRMPIANREAQSRFGITPIRIGHLRDEAEHCRATAGARQAG